MKFCKYGYFLVVHFFALVGIGFVAVFLAVKFKFTNVEGSVDELSDKFNQQALVLGVATSIPEIDSQDWQEVANLEGKIASLNKIKEDKIFRLCRLWELGYIAPANVLPALELLKSNRMLMVDKIVTAVETRVAEIKTYEENIKNCQNKFFENPIDLPKLENKITKSNSENIFNWANQKQWFDVKDSIVKDKEQILKATSIAKIEPRILVSSLMVEQLRLFYSQRELYKKIFEPLKILANSYQISLGVMSIKEETAIQIENHLKDVGSPYYLGKEYEKILDYDAGADVAKERFSRLTSVNHFWNYLYGSLYLKQMLTQWENAGIDIKGRPEVVATLFNVGFPQSKPNPNPKVGGSTVIINNISYTFGRLAYEFYYSGEMRDIFGWVN